MTVTRTLDFVKAPQYRSVCMVRISNSAYASVAQRYWNEAWTSEKNSEVYGDLASAEGVGANVRIVPELESEPDADAMLVSALAELKAMIDHKSCPRTLERMTQMLGERLF